jgi:hypothetical protein
MITDTEFNAANKRAEKKLASTQVATGVRYDNRTSRIVITFSSGLELTVSPKSVQGLDNAQPADLIETEITPSGLGIYFPKIDADLYIPSLLNGLLGTEKWMAENGRKGGKARTEVKILASRENGKLGGRPRISTAT